MRQLFLDDLRSPRPGPGVCPECFNFTRGGFDRCFACETGERHLEVVVPISYSVGMERLHQDLAGYKRLADPSVGPATARLAAILSAFLVRHEACVAAAAGVSRFDVVTTVPSGEPRRDELHPLRRIVGELTGPTAERHERLLRSSRRARADRRFDPGRYETVRSLDGANVLLIDDMWTSGASAQSAAAALRRAGASPVAAVVIGRHLNRGWHQNDLRLRRLSRSFDFASCALCAGASMAAQAA